MDNEHTVLLPALMWEALVTFIRQRRSTLPNKLQRELRQSDKPGLLLRLRLRDGSVRLVWVNWNGCVFDEWYEEWGSRAEVYGPPRFTADDIESWGNYDYVRQPSWRDPFKKIRVWRVIVRADGQPGELHP